MPAPLLVLWKRDPVPRLLPVIDGWNILDDNLLACPREHVEAVFAMLRRQGRRIEFTGGLEALSLQDYQVELLASLRLRPARLSAPLGAACDHSRPGSGALRKVASGARTHQSRTGRSTG